MEHEKKFAEEGDVGATLVGHDGASLSLGEGVAAIFEFAKERTQPKRERFKDPTGICPDVEAVVGHAGDGGTKVEIITFNRKEWMDRPRRRSGTIIATTLESFIAMTNRQSGESSVIFADDGPAPKLTAVLNFHGSGAEGKPEFGDDRVQYQFPLSDEWKKWLGMNGHKFDVIAFAEWIENGLFEIGEPSAAGAISTAFASESGVKLAGRQALLGLSKGLSVRVEHRVAKTVNLQSGEGRIEYSEEHHDDNGGPLIVPAAFHLMIPVFRGGSRYSIPVRLRYRTGGGKITWFYEIHRAELFILDAVTEALEIVRKDEENMDGDRPAPGCGLPVFMGSVHGHDGQSVMR